MNRFLVTGLCISRNLGGPAMALTLVENIRCRYPDAQFRFAVSAPDLAIERDWANKYGLEVVPRTNLVCGLELCPPVRVVNRLRGRSVDAQFWKAAHGEFMKAFDWADRVINMAGISYVGGVRASICDYSYFSYARRKRKPYCRFVQSLGPFKDWRVRFIARRELRNVPFIAARGRHTAQYCRELVPEQEVLDVPDVAILMGAAGDDWGDEQLARWGLKPGEYTTLCPSAVMRHMPGDAAGSVGAKHVDSFVQLAKALLAGGALILFLPHMYSDRPRESDREVSREIITALPQSAKVALVEDDIDPRQAKWLISHSRQAVVSRYHALVAAVSTATPVVAIGWNVKYRDLMDYYEIGDMAIDARELPADALAQEATARLKAYDTGRVERMRELQSTNVDEALAAFDRLYRWIDHGA